MADKALLYERRKAVVRLAHLLTDTHTQRGLTDAWQALRNLHDSDTAALAEFDSFLQEMRLRASTIPLAPEVTHA